MERYPEAIFSATAVIAILVGPSATTLCCCNPADLAGVIQVAGASATAGTHIAALATTSNPLGSATTSSPRSVAMALSVSSLAACPSTFLAGSASLQVNRGESRVTCKKADIHPKFFDDAKVYCNGELVMTTGGTQNEYVVDVWSGNHPFYQGNKSALLLDADRVEKFRQRYGGFSTIQEIPTGLTGEIVFEKKKKGAKGKGKK